MLRSMENKKAGKLPCLFFTNQKAYFFSSFLASFFAAFFAFFSPLFLSPFFISSFLSIGLAPVWDMARAAPPETAKMAATNSDTSFFIRYLLCWALLG